MLLDMRKMKILQAIIDDYILSASPVGSRTISKRSDIGLSSATIRNEMSDLEELGLLEQPHTSAGRIPSDKAYRLYVNDMLRRWQLTDQEARFINTHIDRRVVEVEDIIKQTAWVLANVTHYTSMVLKPQLSDIKLKQIQLIPISSGRALAVIITDAGITRDAVIRIPAGMRDSDMERLSNMLTAKLSSRKLEDVQSRLMPELSYEFSEYRDFCVSLVQKLQRDIKPDAAGVELSGATNIFNHPEYSDLDKAKGILNALEAKDMLYCLLRDAVKLEFSVTIGSEHQNPEMKNCSVVTATYRIGDSPIGSLGVIGPTRMDYSRILAVLEYVGQSLSEILTNLLEDERT